MFMILDWKKASLGSRIWTWTKMILKEGVLHQQWKNVFRNRKVGGSITIPQELVTTLKLQGVEFLHNDYSFKEKVDTLIVLKDPRCLKWALLQKKKSKVRRVLAGPLVANLPSEAGGVMMDKDLDGLIFFSPWQRDLFLKYAPDKNIKTYIWAAGVNTDYWLPAKNPGQKILIYNKNPDPGLLEHITQTLNDLGLTYEILTYGSYDFITFQNSLKQSRMAIFLSRTETQGVAMLEAWSSGVPTLHWDPGVWIYLGEKVSGASSCPYLSNEAGMKFKGTEDFSFCLNKMLEQLPNFKPRDYVLNHFTREKSAQDFLNLTKSQ